MLKKALLHCTGMFRTEKRGGKRGYIGLGPKYIGLFRKETRTIRSYVRRPTWSLASTITSKEEEGEEEGVSKIWTSKVENDLLNCAARC